MRSPLDDFCELIAAVGLSNAQKLQQRLQLRLLERGGVTLDSGRQRTVVRDFAFMNWVVANGVWSNLENNRLRQDLMVASLKAFCLKTSCVCSESQSITDIAYLAAEIEEQFKRFMAGYKAALQEFEAHGVPLDARIAMVFTIEHLQEDLALPNDIWGTVVPGFILESEDYAEIESLAFETNRAVTDRKGHSDPA